MPDFSVPDWIKPPSPEEQERIDAASAAASRNAYSMIKRGIGVARMRAETQEAIKNGVDPYTAHQNALINNGHLLFADNPQAFENVFSKEHVNAVKEAALEQRGLELERRNKLLSDNQDRLAKKDEAMQVLREKGLISEDELRKARIDSLKANSLLEIVKAQMNADSSAEKSDLARERLDFQKSKVSPAAQEAKDFADLQRKLKTATEDLQAGIGVRSIQDTKAKRADVEDLQNQISAMEARRNLEEIKVESPGGPTVQISRGQKSGVPTAVASELQKQMAAGATTMDTISQTLPQIKGHVGPLGVFKEGIETLANIINPGSVAPETTEARTLMRIGRQEIISAMRQPGMVSNMERSMLDEIGDVTKFLESDEGAETKMRVLRDLLAAKAVRNSKLLHQPPPQQALMYLPRKLADQLKTEGNFSIEDAKRWYAIHKAMEKAKP